ncbi:MAG TPA: phospho-sugar mutase [Acidimicrobiales bacterium]|nr:phospho-sugar mutase [Acidimicrobiales bacterium]
MAPADVVAAARAWRDADVDAGDQAEVDALLDRNDAGDAAALEELQDRFGDGLTFGTAGLRGEMAAGPNRMNRAVVIRATAGLAAHLVATGHRGEPVVVGSDARHRSPRFAADAAAVLAQADLRPLLADRPLPTPVLAFGVRQFDACAGIVITASHNPPRYNGYKVFLGDGAQIAPPSDAEIAACIDAVGGASSVPRAADDDPRIASVGDALVDAYLTGAVATALPAGPPADGVAATPADRRALGVVYTPMHGVGRDVVLAAFDRAGFALPHVVAAQGEPDPDFATVAFPNPEEPGALDLAVAAARARSADVVLANDPDADRLAVAVPDAASRGGWRTLSGDEIGLLLADWLLARDTGPDRLVVTTIVSSSALSRLAAARGVVSAEVLTGFKWIARAAFDRPDLRFVYGYEEAVGSSVGTLVRDKDGITAALAVADLVAAERARGRTLLDRLDDLARELGVHATRQRSVRVEGIDGLARMRAAVDRLVASPPDRLAGRPVTAVEDLRRGGRLPPTDGVVLRGDGVRLIVRPSGTEPKLKCYAEAVVPVAHGGDAAALAAARAEGAATVAALLDDAGRLVGG